MPVGNIDEVRAELRRIREEQKANSFRPFVNRVSFKVGEPETVRFLQNIDEVGWAWVHEAPARQGRSFGDMVPCRNQSASDGQEACPGCERGLKRQFRSYASVIWRNGPVYGTTEDGKTDRSNIVSYQDQVAIIEKGSQFFDKLVAADGTYKGLTTRDFNITKEKEEYPTYDIQPAVDEEGNSTATPASKEDLKLAEEAYDVAEFITPFDYEETAAKLSGQQSTNNTPVVVDTPEDVENPFAKAIRR